jgi:pantoate--beta-alanine ligase
MKVIRSIQELNDTLNPLRIQGNQIGFVPTMGALHEGHLSLVSVCVQQNDISVVSIYVNPTQFNNRNDLINYPRDLEKDSKFLKPAGCDYIFAPEDQEMYPEEDNRRFDFGLLGSVMEGKHRPGHFNGVAQIVTKLFDAVKPDRAYFGQKDFQQLAIVRSLVKKSGYNIVITACPIIREKDGLAMSSRNLLLTPEQRAIAPGIYKALMEGKGLIFSKSPVEIEEIIISTINSNPLLKVEYCQVVNPESLQPLRELIPGKPGIICIAVFAGNIRLIDNVEFIS